MNVTALASEHGQHELDDAASASKAEPAHTALASSGEPHSPGLPR